MEDPAFRVAAVVRHMYFVERLPARVIVARLRSMGVVDREGKPFDLPAVMDMLRNPRLQKN
jgi:hypothetical protein